MPVKPLRSLLALILGLAVMSPAVAATALEAPDRNGVTLTAAAGTAGVVRPGEDMRVSATILNERSAPVNDAFVTVSLATSRSASLSDLDTWFVTGESTEPARVIGRSADLLIGARSSAGVVIDVPATDLGLVDPGAYRLTVTLETPDGRLAESRSAIVWHPEAIVGPIALGVVAPITVPPTAGGLIPAEDLERYTAPDGLLSRRLQSVIGRPITLAVDPMVTASIRALGTAAPASATGWLMRLMAATNDSFALGYADADPTATLQAAGTLPAPTGFAFALDPADFATAGDQPDGGTPTLPTTAQLVDVPDSLGTVAWPAADTVTAADLSGLRANRIGRAVLMSSNLDGAGSSAVVDIDGSSVYVMDAAVTRLLRDAVSAGSDEAWQRSASRLLAALATTATEHPGGRTVIAGVDRVTLAEFNGRLSRTLDLLGALPWVAPTPLGALPGPAGSASVVDRQQPVERLMAVRRLLDAEQRDSAIATAAEQPSLVTDERRIALLGTLAQSLIGDPDAWRLASDRYLEQSTALAGAVHVAERGQILVLADRSQLPITVQNDLDLPAVVRIQTRALTGGLAIEQGSIEVTVEPQSQRNVPVPVQSVANGEVTVIVSLASTTGVPLGDPVALRVNVQAGWETAGTIIAGSVVLLVFLVGLVRTVLRRRGARTGEDGTAAAAPVTAAADG